MASPCVVTAPTSRKRRRSRCTHTKPCTENFPKISNSFIITVLLAAYAAVVQGESRTLRHYRQQQHVDAIDLGRASISSRIDEQRFVRRANEIANGNTDSWSQDNNIGGTTISGLFQALDDEKLETHYGIGQLSSTDSQSIHEGGHYQKPASLISTETGDIGRSDGNITDSIVNSLDYPSAQDDSMSENDKSDSIITNLFQYPKERNVYYDYAIGKGGEGKEIEITQSEDLNRFDTTNLDDDSMSDGSVCTIPEFECCSNENCMNGDDVCVHRNCIRDGYFRFTLKWIGDDDYDLFVVTPDGTEISYYNIYDPASLGRFDRDIDYMFDEEGYGYHVENIYFPIEGGPPGVYRFYVRPFTTVGESDEWTVTVKEAGNLVASASGVGSSESFFCKKDDNPATNHPITSPNPIGSPTKNPNLSPTAHPPTQSPPSINPPAPISPIASPTTFSPTQKLPTANPPAPINPPAPTSPPTATPVEFPVRPPLGQPTMVPVSLPPGVVPTVSPEINRPKPEPPACNSVDDECCIDGDCAESTGDLCIQRTCISEGSLRITLEWVGDDNLDLFVETPSNAVISNSLDFDAESGGRHESSKQSTFGFNVESVHFPPSGAPAGKYRIHVAASQIEGVGADVWTIRIYEDGEMRFEQTGFGTSSVYSYDYQGKPPDQQCDADCSSDEFCAFNACVKKGAPQFLLSYELDYDMSLTIVTPESGTISWEYPLDLESGGQFEEYLDFANNRRIQNIYFAPEEGPRGLYPYSVHSFETGTNDDAWTVTIYIDGKQVSSEGGRGSSEILFFDYTGDLPTKGPTKSPTFSSMLPTAAPTACDPFTDEEVLVECCSDSDCFPNEACASGTCVDEGNPRFTLSWKGENDLDLLVVTPLNTVISNSVLEDPESGGKFGEDYDQFGYGLHVENIYFPLVGGPAGVYSFFVRSFLSDGIDDEWTVGVYVNGIEKLSVTGTGSSQELKFDYSP